MIRNISEKERKNNIGPRLENSTETSWLRLTNNAFKRDSNSYDMYGFFEWLTIPVFNLTDTVVLSITANGVMDYSESMADVQYYLLNTGEDPAIDDLYYPSNNYDSFQTSLTGFGYIFPLRGIIRK